LQPNARGTIVTTSYYSKAALAEAADGNKKPIVLVDGYHLASLFISNSILVE